MGLVNSRILVGGVRMFGNFVYLLDAAHASMPIERAMDEALPALRIPKGAGKFKKVGAKGRIASARPGQTDSGIPTPPRMTPFTSGAMGSRCRDPRCGGGLPSWRPRTASTSMSRRRLRRS